MQTAHLRWRIGINLRRIPLRGLLLLINIVFFSNVLTAQQVLKPKYNVLFIAADDLNCDLNTYGHNSVKSPNVDRLSQMGTRFDRAYCQFPLCSPSRTSIMTGLRPSTIQVFDLQKHFRDVRPDIVTLPQLFEKAGYFTARVGKIYHFGNPGQIGTDGLDDTLSWKERYNPRGREKDEEDLLIDYTPQRGKGASLNWAMAEGSDEEQTDGKVATQTIELLKNHHTQPFFIATGFYRPHCPYVAPKKYFDLYPLEGIQLPVDPVNDLDDVPQAAQFTKPPNWDVSEENRRRAVRAYLATISFVDAQMGRIFQTMDSLDLWKNTIVVFWSDHGYATGQHSQWQKQTLFEESARVPLIIYAPGMQHKGAGSPAVVELLDVYPTLADLCGLNSPADLEGASLAPLLKNPYQTWNRPAFTQTWRGKFPGYSVRTERWRYTEWEHGKEGIELYDHQNDPKEWHNLADDSQYAPVRAELKALLDNNWPADVWTPLQKQ